MFLISLMASGISLNVTQTLIVSQVVLSFVLPVRLIALLLLTSRRDTMGAMTNARWVTALAAIAARRS